MVTVTELVTWKRAFKRLRKVSLQSNQLTTKTAGNRIKTARQKMKKVLLVLIALMGIGFGAKAQSCEVGENTYVAVRAWVNSDSKIECSASCYGDAKPTSGTVYATVYYIDKNGNEGSEMISINWSSIDGDRIGGSSATWTGYHTNIARITRWEVSAGACRIEKK